MSTPKQVLELHKQNIEMLMKKLQAAIDNHQQAVEKTQNKNPDSWAGVGNGSEFQHIENCLAELIKDFSV